MPAETLHQQYGVYITTYLIIIYDSYILYIHFSTPNNWEEGEAE